MSSGVKRSLVPLGDRSKNTSMCFSTYPFFQNFKGSTPSGLF
jgi:hypothetical protein